jgi:YHS domain-containing protein
MPVTRRTLFAVLACLVFFPAAGVHSQATTPVKLAMKGYDPVAYFTDGKAISGSSAFSYVWDGLRYQFASAAHRDMFAAKPSQYAPQYSGSCAASMASGLKIEADPESWAIADGRLFLFAGPRGIDMLRGNSALVANADHNWQKITSPASH